jgi:dimeric dUTPase (all-alpha-NTP-PPase superfamily)
MGNVGIGTSTNLTSNLTIQGRTLFNNIASFSNSIYQSNINTPNYFAGKVGIGTTNAIANLTIKSSYTDENTGFCIDANDNPLNNPGYYSLKIYPFGQGAAQIGYKFKFNY